MTRLPLNRTAWAGLALFLLFITPMIFAADKPSTTDSASTTQMRDRQSKSEEEKRAEQRDMEKRKLRARLVVAESQFSDCERELTSMLRRMKELAKRMGHNGLSRKTREKLFLNAAQSMYEIRTDIAVKKALIAHLGKSEKMTKPIADKIAALKTDLVVLKAKEQVAEESVAITREIIESMGKSVEIELMQFEVRLQKKRLGKLYERIEDLKDELRQP